MPGECKCTFIQRMLGDGCKVCNPSMWQEYDKLTCWDCGAEIEKGGDDAGICIECGGRNSRVKSKMKGRPDPSKGPMPAKDDIKCA